MRLRTALAAAAVVVAVSAASAGADAPAQSVRARLVDEVERGLARADARWGWRGWYRDRPSTAAWASVWDTLHLLEARVGLHAAAPTAEHRASLIRMAVLSEGYWNPGLGHGLGGFATGYRLRGVQGTNWYDDGAWLGLAFMDVYEQTGLPRFLDDAERAFRFVYRVGWDPVAGGLWWNSQRTVKAAESVNAAALLAVELYDAHRGVAYLRAGRRLVDWADANLLDPVTGLYDNHPSDGVAISYNQSPMLAAFVRLCRDGKGYCERIDPLRRASLARFGRELDQPPQYDSMYLRYLFAADQSATTASVVLANAERIERNAVDRNGFYLRGWDGDMSGIAPGLISVHGAALEVLAWAAVASGR